MRRTLLAALGLLTLLAPERIVDVARRVAAEDPAACELEPWVVPVARLEGLLYLVVGARGDAAHPAWTALVGLLGLPALLAPRTSVDIATRVAFEDPADCRWRPWVYPVGRVVGAGLVLFALVELRRE